MTPDNGKNIIQSLNPAYLYLLALKGAGGFTAIVADDLSGGYSTIEAAVAAGEKYIFVKDGSYSITADLVLEGVTIIGQSTQGVIISLTHTIHMADANNSTTAGTARFTNNDKTVNGAGSSFNSVPTANPNKYIFASGMLGEIDSIAGADSMELFSAFFGPTLDYDGLTFTFAHQTFDVDAVGSRIENLTILHSPAGADNAIEISGVRSQCKNINFRSIGITSTFIACPRNTSQISVYTTIESCRFEGGDVGIKLYNAKHTRIVGCDFFGNSSSGIELTANTARTIIEKNNFGGLTLGVNFSGNALGTSILFNEFVQTYSFAIAMNRGGTDSYTLILGNTFDECNPSSGTPYAVYIDANYIIISNNTWIGGDKCLWFEDSQNVAIVNNIFKYWGSYAITMNSTDTQRNFNICGNTFKAESGHTGQCLNLDGAEVVCSNNNFQNVEEYCIRSAALYSTISHNTFRDCGMCALLISGGIYQKVIGNTMFSCAYSIQVDAGADSATIIGNAIIDDTQKGILISSDYCIIEGNRVENCTSNNIEIEATADRAVITGNISLNSGGTNILNNGTNTVAANNITA